MKKILLSILIVFMITAHGQNKLLSSINESYYNDSWQKNGGENYEYDSNNNLIALTDFNWNAVLNVWEVRYKTTYSYNTNNKVTQEIFQKWNATNNQLQNSSKDLYTYTNGRLTEILFQDWIGSSWVNVYKIGVTFNLNNLPATALSYDWNGTQWVNADRTTFTYNGNNKVISDLYEEWIGAQWVNSLKTLYTFNTNDKIIYDRTADWDDFNAIWVERDRTDYVLDVAGNRISETGKENDYQYKDEYTYDTFNLMSSFAHPFKDKTGLDYFTEDFPYVNKVLVENSFSFNNNTNSFEISSRTTYNYNNAITLGTDTFKKEVATITVYPNPTKDFLNIQNESNTTIDKITVTNLLGKKVLEQNNSNPFDVQNLAKGVYILEVISGKNKMVEKFIKE